MKKLLAGVIAALILSSFVGCTDSTPGQKGSQTTSPDAPKKDSC